MAAKISPELHAYHAFIKATFARGGSLEDATPEAFLEFQGTVRAVHQAIDDMQAGDEGRTAREMIDEARQALEIRA